MKNTVNIRYVNNTNLLDYLYNEHISKLYTISKDTYKILNDNILGIRDTRNNSAHKDKSINKKAILGWIKSLQDYFN